MKRIIGKNGRCGVLKYFASVTSFVSAGVVDEVVFFLVTNIEHSVIANPAPIAEQDLYTGSTVGELGCWIDSSITRMVQTGLEHARVPDVGSYLEQGMTLVIL